MNSEAYSSFNGVTFDCRSKYTTGSTQNNKQRDKNPCYEWSSLTKVDISNKYTITERSNFNILQEICETHTPNDETEKFVTVNKEAAAECIPTKPRAK